MRSARALAVIAALLEDHQRMEPHHEDMCRLCRDARSVLTAKPKRSVRAHKSEKAKKDRTKKEKRQDVRAQVMARANGRCECCGMEMIGDALEFDHFRGRAREESVESCWALARLHHRGKTNNVPNRALWLARFMNHCQRHGYAEQAKKCRRELEAEDLIAEAAALSRGGGQ